MEEKARESESETESESEKEREREIPTDGSMDQRTDRRTHPLIKLRTRN